MPLAAPDCGWRISKVSYLLVMQQLVDSFGTQVSHQMPLQRLLSRLIPRAEPGAMGIELQTLKGGLERLAAGLPASPPSLEKHRAAQCEQHCDINTTSCMRPAMQGTPDSQHWESNYILCVCNSWSGQCLLGISPLLQH